MGYLSRVSHLAHEEPELGSNVMMIDRREFVAYTAVVAVAPTLKLLPRPLTSDDTELSPVAFMIEGWSSRDDGESAKVVWIRIGHGWRATWR
jgi:hypothetical protein